MLIYSKMNETNEQKTTTNNSNGKTHTAQHKKCIYLLQYSVTSYVQCTWRLELMEINVINCCMYLQQRSESEKQIHKFALEMIHTHTERIIDVCSPHFGHQCVCLFSFHFISFHLNLFFIIHFSLPLFFACVNAAACCNCCCCCCHCYWLLSLCVLDTRHFITFSNGKSEAHNFALYALQYKLIIIQPNCVKPTMRHNI